VPQFLDYFLDRSICDALTLNLPRGCYTEDNSSASMVKHSTGGFCGFRSLARGFLELLRLGLALRDEAVTEERDHAR